MYKYNGLLFEKLENLEKTKRDVNKAKEDAIASAIKGFNPFDDLVKRHKEAVNAAVKSIKSEFKKNKTNENKITFSTNYMKNGQFVWPKDGYMMIGCHIYMESKKGFFKRLFTGSISNWFLHVGVAALKTYVKIFAGDDYAKQITSDTCTNAIGEGENEGKTSYFCCIKIPASK